MTLKYQIWDQSGTNMVEPSASKFQNGFAQDYSPESAEINYLLRMITENRVPVGTTIFTFDNRIDTGNQGYLALQGGAIGSASSGAGYWADDLAEDVFTYLWTYDSTVVVNPSRGASAAADWAANKTITLPAMWGVTIGGISTVPGSVFNATPGTVVGTETVTLTESQLPEITPTVTDTEHDHTLTFETITPAQTVGSGEAHLNVQPTILGYFWMKY